MQHDATNVPEYLAGLPAPRRAAVQIACDRLREARDVAETFQHGMPFFTFDDQQFIAVASQKHHVSVYVAGLDQTLADQPDLAAAVNGINRGKSCLRFRDTQLDRLTSDLVDSLIKATHQWWAVHAS